MYTLIHDPATTRDGTHGRRVEPRSPRRRVGGGFEAGVRVVNGSPVSPRPKLASRWLNCDQSGDAASESSRSLEGLSGMGLVDIAFTLPDFLTGSPQGRSLCPA